METYNFIPAILFLFSIVVVAICYLIHRHYRHKEVMRHGYPPIELVVDDILIKENIYEDEEEDELELYHKEIDRIERTISERQKTEDLLKKVDIVIKGQEARGILSEPEPKYIKCIKYPGQAYKEGKIYEIWDKYGVIQNESGDFMYQSDWVSFCNKAQGAIGKWRVATKEEFEAQENPSNQIPMFPSQS